MTDRERLKRLIDRLSVFAERQKNTEANTDFMKGYLAGKYDAYNFCIELIQEEFGLKEEGKDE